MGPCPSYHRSSSVPFGARSSAVDFSRPGAKDAVYDDTVTPTTGSRLHRRLTLCPYVPTAILLGETVDAGSFVEVAPYLCHCRVMRRGGPVV